MLSQIKSLNTKKIKTLFCADVDTGSHQVGLDLCPLYGRFSHVGLVTSAQHTKMATPVEVWMKDEHCFDIFFLVSEGNKSICCMKCHYGNAGICRNSDSDAILSQLYRITCARGLQSEMLLLWHPLESSESNHHLKTLRTAQYHCPVTVWQIQGYILPV